MLVSRNWIIFVIAGYFSCGVDKHKESDLANLFDAIVQRKKDQVQLIASSHKILDTKSKSGLTSLLVALQDKEMVEFLLKLGADPNGSLDPEEIPIVAAGRLRKNEVVRLLLDHGANLNLQDKIFGQSILHVAAENNDLPLVKLLVERGADINLEARQYLGSDKPGDYIGGYTPLWFTTDYQIAKYLINKKANLRQQTISRENVLHAAAQRNQIGLLRALIEAKLDLDDQTKEGKTALTLASEAQNTEVVKLLLAAGAKN